MDGQRNGQTDGWMIQSKVENSYIKIQMNTLDTHQTITWLLGNRSDIMR